MSPTMSPSKSDKNQPSKYIILAPDHTLESGYGCNCCLFMYWVHHAALLNPKALHGTVISLYDSTSLFYTHSGITLLPLLMLQLHPVDKRFRSLEWNYIQRGIGSLVQRYSPSRSNMPSRSSGHYVAVGRNGTSSVSLEGVRPHPNGYCATARHDNIPHLLRTVITLGKYGTLHPSLSIYTLLLLDGKETRKMKLCLHCTPT